MSVPSRAGRCALRDLRRDLKDAVAEVNRQGHTAIEPLGLAETLVQTRERYDFVEDYDLVLRAHCRLSRLG